MDELKELLERFKKIEQEIKEGITTVSEEQKESELLDAYNEIILYAYPVWQSTDKKLKENMKTTLVGIHRRLMNSLDTLKSEIEVPTYLTTEIKVKEKSQKTEREHKNNNTMEDINELRERFRELELSLIASQERTRNVEEQMVNIA